MQIDFTLNSWSNCFLKSKLFTMIFFGYLKNNLNINLLNRFDDQPGGAVFDLVIISILNMQEKKNSIYICLKRQN